MRLEFNAKDATKERKNGSLTLGLGLFLTRMALITCLPDILLPWENAFMPSTYKYGFLPKARGRALEAALAEFYECKKQVKKIEHETKALSERMVFLGALLGYGVDA